MNACMTGSSEDHTGLKTIKNLAEIKFLRQHQPLTVLTFEESICVAFGAKYDFQLALT